MAQSDEKGTSELLVGAAIHVHCDDLIDALTKGLERHPELLARAVASLPPQLAPTPEPVRQESRWPSDPGAFASLLRVRRAEARLTREQLSIQSGIAASTIRNIESRRHRPTDTTQLLIARAFDSASERAEAAAGPAPEPRQR